jgi:hypothetical protein
MVGNGNFDWHYWWSGFQLKTMDTFLTDDYFFTGDGYIQDYSLQLSSE